MGEAAYSFIWQLTAVAFCLAVAVTLVELVQHACNRDYSRFDHVQDRRGNWVLSTRAELRELRSALARARQISDELEAPS